MKKIQVKFKKNNKVEKSSIKILTFKKSGAIIIMQVEFNSTKNNSSKERSVDMTNYDYSKLKGKIKEVYNLQSSFANALEISETSLSKKLNNIVTFSQDEIKKAKEILNLSDKEVFEYFFTSKVELNSTKTA